MRQVQNYGIHLSSKQIAHAKRIETKDNLAGKQKVYAAYKAWQAAIEKLAALSNELDPLRIRDAMEQIPKYEAQIKLLWAEYERLAKEYGTDAAAFQADMDNYVTAFEREAVVVAKDMLDQGENQLQVQQQALTEANLNKLFKDLSKARAELDKVGDGRPFKVFLSDDYRAMQSEVVAHSKTDPLLKDHFAA